MNTAIFNFYIFFAYIFIYSLLIVEAKHFSVINVIKSIAKKEGFFSFELDPQQDKMKTISIKIEMNM